MTLTPDGGGGKYPSSPPTFDHLEVPTWEFLKSIVVTPLVPLDVSSERAPCVLPYDLSSTSLGAPEITLGTHQFTHFGLWT